MDNARIDGSYLVLSGSHYFKVFDIAASEF